MGAVKFSSYGRNTFKQVTKLRRLHAEQWKVVLDFAPKTSCYILIVAFQSDQQKKVATWAK